MNSLRVLSAAAALALVVPMTSPSFAQGPSARVSGAPQVGGGGGAHIGGGGGGFGGGARMGGGPAIQGGGGNFAAGPAARPSGGNFVASPSPRTAFAPSVSGDRSVATAGNWQGGSNWSGRHWHHHRGGFWPGFAAGAAIGGIGSYAYYGGGYYDDPYYYGDSYYDEPSVAVVPDSGGDSAAYCAQRYRSYDPASGTYLGYDGQRHPCP
ncbi:BA14K family protein [Bradyrhizobium guangxiense]|uniref:BA14K family protein n=1 Tax=Bradyrhizobium guangxiense TaxID=1325115 RepID=UPI001008F3AD|nr:BA14K family protein [Bradyrhizobium guangxiense]